MNNLFYTLFLVLLLGGICSAWDEDGRLSEENQAIINEKRQTIESEIATLKDHPWAGRYYFGNGLGKNVTLTLAPENGFTVTWRGCLGLYDQNHGTADWNGDTLKLSFAFDVAEGYIGNYANEYMPIRWGERIYLIRADGIIEFCNAINSRTEPRTGVYGRFLLRREDEKKEAKGKPQLPEKFMPYLLDKPVDAAIVSIKDTREGKITEKIATVVVNKGKKDGLLPGMELNVVRPGSVYGEVRLIKVEETQSEGEFRYDFPHERTRFSFLTRKPVPAAGWRLSTVPGWQR